MICQNCGKEEARKLVEVVRFGRPVKMQVCEFCARNLELEKDENFEVGDKYFSAFFGGVTRKEIVCPACGTTLSEFLSTGYVGCAVCYRTFPDTVRVAENFHGKSKHVGKIPKKQLQKVSNEIAVEKIKEQIKDAVKIEDYQLASELKRKLIELGGVYDKKQS